MTIGKLLTPDRVLVDLRVPDKPRLLDLLARRSAEAAGLEAAVIVEALTVRERLGSTGMGSGIAMPHARLPGLAHPVGLFARLKPAVAFDAVDERRVDLVFLLLLPAHTRGEQLNTLACVARRLRDAATAAALRGAHDAASLHAILAAEV